MESEVMFRLFMILFVSRYFRLVIGVLANLLYRPYPKANHAKHKPEDVSVIVPTTFKHPDALIDCLKSIQICKPTIIYVVSAYANLGQIAELCKQVSSSIKILGVHHLNKRRQMLQALPLVKTNIVVFADDDVVWPSGYLEELLAIFEVAGVGARGTRQRVHRDDKPSIWNFLGISYLERRVFNNITTQAIDGSISTLSGRTAAYRTHILKNEDFYHYFLHDSWFGRKLNTDDDKCLTRFVYSKGWKIALQSSTEIETKMDSGWDYVEQCKRWARAHWRGNFVVMTNENYWYSPRYLWGFYVIYLGQFQTPALLIDGILFWLLKESTSKENQQLALFFLVIWILSTKLFKLVPHFCKYPADLKFIPASLLFSYLHGLINIYSLFTLHVTAWGNQKLEELELRRDGGVVDKKLEMIDNTCIADSGYTSGGDS